jgi:hypothetical protein
MVCTEYPCAPLSHKNRYLHYDKNTAILRLRLHHQKQRERDELKEWSYKMRFCLNSCELNQYILYSRWWFSNCFLFMSRISNQDVYLTATKFLYFLNYFRVPKAEIVIMKSPTKNRENKDILVRISAGISRINGQMTKWMKSFYLNKPFMILKTIVASTASTHFTLKFLSKQPSSREKYPSSRNKIVSHPLMRLSF